MNLYISHESINTQRVRQNDTIIENHKQTKTNNHVPMIRKLFVNQGLPDCNARNNDDKEQLMLLHVRHSTFYIPNPSEEHKSSQIPSVQRECATLHLTHLPHSTRPAQVMCLLYNVPQMMRNVHFHSPMLFSTHSVSHNSHFFHSSNTKTSPKHI